MHELYADLATVSFLIGLNQITKDPLLFSLNDGTTVGHLDSEFTVHVSFSETIAGRVEH